MAPEGFVACMRNFISGSTVCMLTTHTSPDIKQNPPSILAANCGTTGVAFQIVSSTGIGISMCMSVCVSVIVSPLPLLGTLTGYHGNVAAVPATQSMQ